MLNDFDMITHSFPGEITIYPIADVHLGAVEHAEVEWQNFLKSVERENAYLILAGDLLNNNTRGTRFANPFDEVLRPREAKRRMTEYLAPLRDRILAVCGGNHEARTAKESDQDLCRDICAKLDLEHLYRENIVFMCVSVGERANENKCQASYNFVIQHGSGGGVLTGSAINKSERSAGIIENVDCYVSGHVHRGFVSKPAKIVMDSRNKRVWTKSYVVVSCVSWLNYGGYAAKANLLPAQICDPQKLRLVADKNKKRIITTW